MISPRRREVPGIVMTPIVIATVDDHLQHGYTLAVHCWRCNKWHDVDLEGLSRQGRGNLGQLYTSQTLARLGAPHREP